MSEVDDMRERWKAYADNVNAAWIVLKAVELPSYWDHPECCERQDLRVVTDGMSQYCTAEPDYDYDAETDETTPRAPMMARTDGWDDMSEDGAVSYLWCSECEAVWAVPAETEWS